MRAALIAGGVYFLLLFGLGFVLGTIQVLLVEPWIGAFAATLVEVPVMLAAAVPACRWAVRRWDVPRAWSCRAAMAVWFLALLLVFEWVLGAVLFGRSAGEQIAALATGAGALGLAAQIAAAALPMGVGRGR